MTIIINSENENKLCPMCKISNINDFQNRELCFDCNLEISYIIQEKENPCLKCNDLTKNWYKKENNGCKIPCIIYNYWYKELMELID